MKIREKINLLAVLSVLVLPASLGITLFTVRDMAQQMQQMANAEDLISSATQLRLIAVETAMFHEARATDQWHKKIVGIQAELDLMRGDSDAERADFGRIRKNIKLAESIYPRLIMHSQAQRNELNSGGKGIDTAMEARTVNGLSVLTQEMMDAAKELITSNRTQVTRAMHMMQLSVAIVVLVMAILVTFFWRLIGNRVLRPLREIERGTRLIAGGDYKYRLNLPQNDEIGALSAAFDAMTANVQQTQDELELEVANTRRSEIALQEGAQYIQAILDNAVDGIITIDSHGMIQSVNRSVQHLFGYTTEEVIGQNIKMLMPEPYHTEHDGYLENYANTGIAKIIGSGREVEGRRKDGSNFPMDLAVSETIHNGQRLFVGLVRDISERRRNDQMKTEFVSTVSHELRTPLTSINGALGLLVAGALGEVPAKMLPMLSIANKNCQRLGRLIDDLLDMEKMAAGKISFDLEVQPLMPLIEQAIEGTQAYAEKFKVSYAVIESVEGVLARVDGGRLQQVLTNLLSNAAKFSLPGDQIKITVNVMDKMVRVSVTDHGAGIPKQFHSRIFQKFAQADSSDTRSKGGTGLGLAISKEMIERMNGVIGFSSEEGIGSCFYFDLPVWRERSPEAVSSLPSLTADTPRLLVVEDEPDIAKLMASMLQRAGYATDIAHDGKSANICLSQHTYVGMTLDLMLPDQSGLSLMRGIRAKTETAQLPIIVVSAFVNEGKLAVNDEVNDIDWIQKPFDENQLVRVVQNAIATRLSQTLRNTQGLSGATIGKYRVLHVENDDDFSSIIATLGQGVAEFSIARELHQATIKLTENIYDVVVLDVSLPDGSGWELLPLLRTLKPPPPVIVLSEVECTAEQRQAVHAVLIKSANTVDELLALLRKLAEQLSKPARRSQDWQKNPRVANTD